MGNSTSMVIFMSAFSLMAILMTLSIQSIDPCSSSLLSNALANSTVISQLNSDSSTCPYNSLSFNNNMYNQANIQRGSTGNMGIGATILSIFPDWLYTGFNWITHSGIFIINIIGAPYTIAVSLFPVQYTSFASAIGAFGSILFLWFLVNWFTGKDN
jgi:hypothetical protein